ncbi:MAG: enoyl-CoA hydratase/isomerase family protein [Thermotaleaceae bacterium]
MANDAEIQYRMSNGTGWITLNRPQALNALSFEMIEKLYEILKLWQEDNNISMICIEGEGNKAFCAGGDVKALYDLKDNNVEAYAFNFFSTEYGMNMTMHTYPKPILAYMNGIVMGGGVGISVGASHRIVTEKTKWAMPEMNIGLFPDVGGSYFLNKMPGYIGRYLALTSTAIDSSDVLYIGAADYYIDSNQWCALKKAIEDRKWSINTAKANLTELIGQFCTKSYPPSSLEGLQKKIDECFRFETMEEILDALKRSAKAGDLWAEKTLNTLMEKSPTSMKVTLQQLIRGREKSMLECFKMELIMSMNFMKSHDFFEGVRAVLVDKDRNPIWKPGTLEEVKEEDVLLFFSI